jgi:hypothetical protein
MDKYQMAHIRTHSLILVDAIINFRLSYKKSDSWEWLFFMSIIQFIFSVIPNLLQPLWRSASPHDAATYKTVIFTSSLLQVCCQEHVQTKSVWNDGLRSWLSFETLGEVHLRSRLSVRSESVLCHVRHLTLNTTVSTSSAVFPGTSFVLRKHDSQSVWPNCNLQPADCTAFVSQACSKLDWRFSAYSFIYLFIYLFIFCLFIYFYDKISGHTNSISCES